MNYGTWMVQVLASVGIAKGRNRSPGNASTAKQLRRIEGYKTDLARPDCKW